VETLVSVESHALDFRSGPMCAVATRPEVVGQLTLSELPDWPLVNARKMAKAVFLLLQTYH
jgi:hypothetical protein